MNDNSSDETRVKSANRIFYNIIASDYENIDGRRRSPELEMWLRGNLIKLRNRVSGGNLLDIGVGSGLVTRCANGIFSNRIGIDLSYNILSLNKDAFESGVTADADHLPFGDSTFDAITCFAVLHHMFDFQKLIIEMKRVLKPGGVFYSDHDLDRSFYNRFYLPLITYRKISGGEKRYLRLIKNKCITQELYKFTEYHGDGLVTELLISQFMSMGFNIKTMYHWFGLFKVSNICFGNKEYKRGYAPIVSIIAQNK